MIDPFIYFMYTSYVSSRFERKINRTSSSSSKKISSLSFTVDDLDRQSFFEIYVESYNFIKKLYREHIQQNLSMLKLVNISK